MKPAPAPWLRNTLEQAVKSLAAGGKPFSTSTLMLAVKSTPTYRDGYMVRRRHTPYIREVLYWAKRLGLVRRVGQTAAEESLWTA